MLAQSPSAHFQKKRFRTHRSMKCESAPVNFTGDTVKLSKPLFHKQETEDSCVPASLKMVIATFGQDVSETELRQLTILVER
jgi:hypothetical protein